MMKLKGIGYTANTAAVTGGIVSEIIYNGNQALEPLAAVANFTANPVGSAAIHTTGYGLISPQYAACTVLASKIRVTIYDDGSNQNLALTVMPSRRGATTGTVTGGEANGMTELKYAKQKIMDYDSGNPRSTQTISHYMTTAKMFAVSPQEVSDDITTYAYAANTASNFPLSRWSWHILVHCPWSATEIDLQYKLKIQMTYYLKFNLNNVDVPEA